MNTGIFLIFGIGILAYVLMKIYDMVRSTKELKQIFVGQKAKLILKEYDEQIALQQEELDEIQAQLDANEKIPSHKQQRKSKKLAEKIEKIENDIYLTKEVRHQFVEVARDYKNNAGSIPTPKMRQHLKEYLNNRRHL